MRCGPCCARAPTYGRTTAPSAAKVNVEYVSANPTGPMHVGHCRGAVFGDALCSLLQFAGHDVTREYYINDAGAQVDVLARSAYLQVSRGARRGHRRDPGRALSRRLSEAGRAGAGGRTWRGLAGDERGAMAADRARQGDRDDDGRDQGRSRRAQHQARCVLLGALADRKRQQQGRRRPSTYLRSSGDVYEGRLPPPKAQPVEDYEDREQTLFRATAYGDDVDRPLIKSDGSYTYFASDIANHKNKFDRGFADLIDVFGADHGGYVKRMQAAVKAVTAGQATLDVKIVQLVRLLRKGEPVKMSKRSGDFVTLREVVDEVGKDAVRFMMLYRKNDAVLDFDLAKVIEQSSENPVFYVQYGHASGHSIFRNARKRCFPTCRRRTGARLAYLATPRSSG